MWDAVRFEILNANDDEISSYAINLLKAIIKSLSFGLLEPTKTSPLGLFLKNVTEICLKELKDIESKMARPAGKLLSACASVSIPAYKYISEVTIPILVALFRESESVNKWTAVLQVLNGFLDMELSSLNDGGGEINPLTMILLLFKDNLFEIYSKGLLGSSSSQITYKITALEGFRNLLSIKGLLAPNEIGTIVQYLNNIVLHDENEDTW
jgi:DNA repair/transcription protein MET18/MMS19